MALQSTAYALNARLVWIVGGIIDLYSDRALYEILSDQMQGTSVLSAKRIR